MANPAWSMLGASTPTVGATSYSQLVNMAGWTGTESNRPGLFSAAGTFSKFRVECSTGPGVGKNIVFTLRVNGVDQTITVTLSGTATSVEDLVHTAAIVAGDKVTLKAVSDAGSAAANIRWYCDFSPTTINEYPISGGYIGEGTQWSATATEFNQLCGGSSNNTTETNEQQLIACPGTLKNFYTNLETATGAAKTRTYAIMVNGVASALTCAVTNGTLANDTSHTVSVVAGDVVSIRAIPTNSPAASRGSWGVTFVPTIAGEQPIMAGFFTNPSASAKNYSVPQVTYVGAPWDASGALVYPIRRGTLKKLYIKATTAPGGSKSYTFALTRNGTDTGVTCAISGAAQVTANDVTHTQDFSAGDNFGISCTPSGTPAATGFLCIGCVLVNTDFGVAQTIQAKARVNQLGVAQTIQAKAAIKQSGVVKTIQAKAAVKQSNVAQTIQAKAAVKQSGVVQTIQAKARVKQQGVAQTIQAKARVQQTVAPTIQAKARIKQLGVVQTVQAKAAVKQSNVVQTVQAKARIQQPNEPETIQAKARIRQTVAPTVQAKAAVMQSGVVQTIQAKSRIQQPNEPETIQAKSRIQQQGVVQTIQGLGRIKQEGIVKTVTAKARVQQTPVQTVQAKATVKFFGLVETVQAKARVKQSGVAKTIQAKARIKPLDGGFFRLRSYQQEWPLPLVDNRIL